MLRKHADRQGGKVLADTVLHRSDEVGVDQVVEQHRRLVADVDQVAVTVEALLL